MKQRRQFLRKYAVRGEKINSAVNEMKNRNLRVIQNELSTGKSEIIKLKKEDRQVTYHRNIEA